MLLWCACVQFHRAHRRCYLRCCYLRLLLPAFVVTCVCCYLRVLLPVSLLPSLLLRAYNTHKFCARTPRERYTPRRAAQTTRCRCTKSCFCSNQDPARGFIFARDGGQHLPLCIVQTNEMHARRHLTGESRSAYRVAYHDRLESRLHSAFCFIFLFQGSRFLLGVFRGSFLSHDSSLG